MFQFLFGLFSPVMLLSSIATIGAYCVLSDARPRHGCARHQCRAAARVWRIMPLLLIQRLCYRHLLYVTALRTGLTALEGTWLAGASSCVPCKVSVNSARRGAAKPIKHLQRQAPQMSVLR